jgi:peptide-methionine (S)-S-oxide reductase
MSSDQASQATKADATTPSAQEAMFGAGCFWGVEMTFAKTPGVLTTAVGYAGGTTERPTYQQVCTDLTGHAEVVHLTFDPAKVTYPQLLKVFFDNHDPTQLNYQGPDEGSQYRTVIFAYGQEQQAQAVAMKKALDESGKYRRPIATVIQAAPTFWKAEEYHQRYLQKKGLDNCHIPSGS